MPVLNSLPDMQFAGYLARGLSEGFKIGFRGTPLRSCRNNMPSVSRKAEAVDHFVREEVHAGRLVQQLETAKVHVSPIGLVPKQGRPDSFRIIVDLSSPPGYSVNDGIDGGWCSLSYTTVSEAARLALSCGTGALMGKVDLKSAYRMVPVHPSDQHLLAIKWRGVTYCDRRLPFGLRSAPKVFNAVADALAWALTVRGVEKTLHYLDDFFFCGPANSPVCQKALDIAVPTLAELGFPTALEKTVGPTTTLVFLGIEIDSTQRELRLPRDKLTRLQSLITQWLGRRSASKHQLQVLVGHLSHAAAVVKPGRIFMRALIALAPA